MISIGENKSILCKGDFHPAQLYKGDKKIAGYESAEFIGNGGVTLEACYNDNLHNVVIHGNSVQDGTPTPEAPVEVQSVGELVTDGEYAGKYKVPVMVRGKNLLYSYRSASRESLKMSMNGSLLTLDGISKSNHGLNYSTAEQILLEAGKTYTFSVRYLGGVLIDSASGFYVGLKTSSGWYKPSGLNMATDITPLIRTHATWKTTFTVTDDTVVSFSCVGCGEYHQLKIGMQLEEGATATAYEPYIKPQTFNIYLDEPLRKVGDYADCVDFEKSLVERYVYTLKGSDILISGKSGEPAANSFYAAYKYSSKALKCRPNVFLVSGATNNVIPLVLCNKLPAITYGTMKSNKNIYGLCVTENASRSANEIRVSLPDTIATTTQEAIQWLNDNDCTVYLVYLDEYITEEPIELPKLPQFKGTTIYEVDTEITATVSGKYKKQEE